MFYLCDKCKVCILVYDVVLEFTKLRTYHFPLKITILGIAGTSKGKGIT